MALNLLVYSADSYTSSLVYLTSDSLSLMTDGSHRQPSVCRVSGICEDLLKRERLERPAVAFVELVLELDPVQAKRVEERGERLHAHEHDDSQREPACSIVAGGRVGCIGGARPDGFMAINGLCAALLCAAPVRVRGRPVAMRSQLARGQGSGKAAPRHWRRGWPRLGRAARLTRPWSRP